MKKFTGLKKNGNSSTSKKSFFETNNQPQIYVPPNYAYAIVDTDSRKELEYRDLIKLENDEDVWSASFARELHQIAQCTEEINGTNTIYFVPHRKIPHGRRVTYSRICVNFLPKKDDLCCTRLTVGGDRIHYPWKKVCTQQDSPRRNYSSTQ